MRVTIIAADKFVSVDGRGFSGLNLSLPANIHAVQWYGTQGEVEYTDAPNAPIESMDDYALALAAWEAAKSTADNPIPLTLEEKRQRAALTRAQFKLALLAGGYLDDVEVMMNNPAISRDVRIMWEDSSAFSRMHPALLAMAAQMGYTDAQMDAVFGIA